MAQQSPETGIGRTAVKNRPEVKAAEGEQKQDREDTWVFRETNLEA